MFSDTFQKIVTFFAYSMLLTHSLTQWCRIFFEKLIVTQLVRQ